MVDDSDPRARRMRVLGGLAGIPTVLAVGALVGFFAGRWIDHRFGTDPWFQLILLGLGLASSVRTARRQLQRVSRDYDKL